MHSKEMLLCQPESVQEDVSIVTNETSSIRNKTVFDFFNKNYLKNRQFLRYIRNYLIVVAVSDTGLSWLSTEQWTNVAHQEVFHRSSNFLAEIVGNQINDSPDCLSVHLPTIKMFWSI